MSATAGIAAQMEQAVAYHSRGQLAEAEGLYRHILAQSSAHFDALHLLGVVCYQTGRHADAAELMRRAIEVEPSQPAVYSNLGLVLQALKRPEEALASYDRCLALSPEYAEALSNRGNALRALGRAEDALESYDRALSLSPGSAIPLNNRATALRMLDRYEEALASCERAIELAPGYADALCNRGNILQDVGRYTEALESYRRALQSDPRHADSHWNEALCLLLIGDYVPGWRKYEWRWMTEQAGTARNFSQRLWLGQEDLAGKTILIHAEQGLGDTLQFCRYVKNLSALGATVVLEVQKPLKALLANLDGVSRVLARGEPLPGFDYHCPLLSLPMAFRTTLSTIPATPGYLRCDPKDVARWREQLGPKRRPRVGLVWKGGSINPKRSIALVELLELVSGDAEFFSLQKDVPPADQSILDTRQDIRQVGAELRNFADAPLVSLMDLVVTVDTSMAHLAGALGGKVWVMLPKNPEWRWLAGREDSPWYPGARLFRAPGFGDWRSVVKRVSDQLNVELG
jgi:tetratricopeptide (TPR) repeat protein